MSDIKRNEVPHCCVSATHRLLEGIICWKDLLAAKAKNKHLLRDFKKFVEVDLHISESRKLLCRVCHRKITKIQVLVKDLQRSWVLGRQISGKSKRVEQSRSSSSCSPSVIPPKKRPHVSSDESHVPRKLFPSADEQGTSEHGDLDYGKA
jgi:hypothetical protein